MRFVFVALATIVLVGAAAAARTAAVVVGDASLAPARVRIDAGGTVTWRNAGTRAHRIASGDGSFAAFTIRPRARRSVKLARAGRHPYTVDGARCGVVFVGVPLGAGCSARGSGGGGAPPTNGTRIYAFDVTIRGRIKNVGFVESSGRREQTWTRTYDWTATFRNFRFKVVTAGSLFAGVNATGSAVRSTARVTETWKHFWQPNPSFPPDADCQGNATGVAPSALLVIGSSSPTNLHVVAQLPGGWSRDAAIAADCNSFAPPTTRVDDSFRGPGGTTVEGFVETLALDFERRAGGLRAPVAALVNGRAFTLDSGVHRSRRPTCEGSCSGTLEIEERYLVIFKPHR